MAKEKKASKKVAPSLLAYERKLEISDGTMYGTIWDDEHVNPVEPLKVIEKGALGTISNRMKTATEGDPAKLNAKIENANPKNVDDCTLSSAKGYDTLKVQFSLNILSGVFTPYSCNDIEFRKAVEKFGDEFVSKNGFKELAYRYAQNIASGRFLWRNRIGAEKIDIVVEAGGETFKFNAFDFSLRKFKRDEQLTPLAEKIEEALSGKVSNLFVNVSAYVKRGKGQRVFPSEELLLDKEDNNKGKTLYQPDGVASIHSQKLGNAIRTIDTWYDDYDTEDGVGPLAVEPYAAAPKQGKAFRAPSTKKDFYTLFDGRILEERPLTEEEELFVVAVLIRGGVFSKKAE